MKASATAAAIRCAATGRIMKQAGKFVMGRLVSVSHLSLLHLPVFRSIVAGYQSSPGSSFTGFASQTIKATTRKPSLTMTARDTWRQDGDPRLAGNRMRGNVMPSQENQTLKALALA